MRTDTPDDSAATHVPLRARISVARALLEDGTRDEYQFLSGRQQARIQEAIEFLRAAEDGFRGPGRE